jgi:hypothetical protein
LLDRECEGRPFGAKRCIDLMMACDRTALNSRLRLRTCVPLDEEEPH